MPGKRVRSDKCALETCTESSKTYSVYCTEHAGASKCRHENCQKPARYNILGAGRQWCLLHACAGMMHNSDESTTVKQCVFPGCQLNVIKRWCSEHTIYDKCRADGCTIPSYYGIAGAGKQWCFEHGTIGMQSERSGRPTTYLEGCAFESCVAKASRKWCEEHMRLSVCKFTGCTTIPVYNLPTAGAQWCAKHRQAHMVDVLSHRCKCSKSSSPLFGYIGDARPEFCSQCKLPDMVNLNKGCYCGSVSNPCFKEPLAPGGTHCVRCKLPGMISTSPVCNCGAARPKFGLPDSSGKATCCSQCRTQDMVDVCTKFCSCVHKGRLMFGHPDDGKAVCCSQCKETGMVDLHHQRCQSDSCSIYSKYERAFPKYRVNDQWLCSSCCQRLHPDVASKGLQMRTELLIIAEIERIIPELSNAVAVIWDCPPNCSSRLAPDRVWFFELDDGDMASIHLEIDEHGKAHEDNDSRIAEIHNGLQTKWSWLVRFNPGPSSDGRSACVVRRVRANGDRYFERADGPEWDHRMNDLKNAITEIYHNISQQQAPTEDTWKVKLFF
jgi:hypothetical protein